VAAALADQQPVISVDTKKKELVGDFRNNGREYRPQGCPEEVRVHDFLIKELGRAVPYGVGHGSGEQLVDEAMPHGIRPGRLARSAQYLGEAFRHVGPHLFGPLTVCYAPAVPAGDTSKRSAQAYGT
jgi:hypothetical protein